MIRRRAGSGSLNTPYIGTEHAVTGTDHLKLTHPPPLTKYSCVLRPGDHPPKTEFLQNYLHVPIVPPAYEALAPNTLVVVWPV